MDKLLAFANFVNEEKLLETKISRSSITRYENGSRTPDYNTLAAIAIALNVDADYLIGKNKKKHIELANDELKQLIDLVNNIIIKDDELINDELWNIISTLNGVIEETLSHNLLGSLKEILDYVSMIIHGSINRNNIEGIKQLQEILINQLKLDYNKHMKEFSSKYIPDILKKIELYGAQKLNDTDIKLLKDFYFDSSINKIPEYLKNILYPNK